METTKNIQLYVIVDAEGKIVQAQYGVNIVATDPFDYFFMVDEDQAENLASYKVVISGMKPSLVAITNETEAK
jgi:hypothetical protein